jgi:hypothetical protein
MGRIRKTTVPMRRRTREFLERLREACRTLLAPHHVGCYPIIHDEEPGTMDGFWTIHDAGEVVGFACDEETALVFALALTLRPPDPDEDLKEARCPS